LKAREPTEAQRRQIRPVALPPVDHRTRVVAVIAAGSAHALTPVVDVPMVLRAVQAMLATALVDRVAVVTADALFPEVERACEAEPVDVRPLVALHGVGAHAVQRMVGARSDGLLTQSDDDIVLLHDACRPLAPDALAATVVEAVRGGHGMAVPAMPLTDTVKSVNERRLVTGTPDRAALRVLQTPIALRARLLPAGAAVGHDPLAAVRCHTAAGGAVHVVPGHPAAFAVRSVWDLELAELIAGGRIRL
jgi:2-C-methyl-D-erythritol 4-phosphate cytidylyltransferase